jgi:glycosyltransferase involved in cell wall biosynthesis
VTVLTADAGNEGKKRECRNGVKVRRYRSIAPNGTMHVCPQIALGVRGTDADFVHAHNYHSFPLLFAALAVGELPFVVTTHYHGRSASSLRNLLLSAYRPMGKQAVRRADEIIAVSEWEHDQLEADFDVEATVIPNGIEVARFESATPFTHDRPYLLTAGRLEEYKGVQHVIRAMSTLPDYDLLIAGSGPYRENLQRIAREVEVEDQVTFLGYVPDDQLPGLYAGASAFVTMSEFEAFGITVAEALAAGTPSVVREMTALRDWVTREGVVGVATPSKSEIRRAIRATEDTESPTLELSSWADVTDRVFRDVYPPISTR